MSHKDIPERQLTSEQLAASSDWNARIRASFKDDTPSPKRERQGESRPANKTLGVVLIFVGVLIAVFMFWPR